MLEHGSGRSLRRLMQPLSKTPLVVDQQLILAVQFAVWAQLSATGRIPTTLTPHSLKSLTDEVVAHVFRELRSLPTLGENGEAFSSDTSQLYSVSEAAFGQLLHEACHLVDGGFIGAELIDEVLTTLNSNGGRSGSFAIPSELVYLLVGLAKLTPGDDVYTPFDETLQLSLAAAQTGADVSTETLLHSPLPHLINLLTEKQIHIASRNPITHPGFVEGKRLRKFAKTVSFPPMGIRFPLETSDRDLYGRFPERTASGSVLAVRHILAQTIGRAVVLAPNSLLFSAGAERSLRQDLVRDGLEAVIGLPPATLFGTAIPLTVLVINLKQRSPHLEILFVDGGAERFHKRDGKGRTTLTGWSDLLRIVDQRLTSDHATAVTPKLIEENDYQLMVARYVRSQLSDAVDKTLRGGELVTLESLVEFVRPLPVSSGSNALDLPIEAIEVGVADMPDYGYISNPKKRVRLAALKNEIQPLDILIAVKGSVGKVGIVPPNLTETWVAGQSCLILRLRDGSQARRVHSPHSLLMYLRSAVGRACLGRITSGTTVPLIQLRELRKLTVLALTRQEQAAVEHAFGDLVMLQQQIEDMRGQQEVLATQFWPLLVIADV